MKRYDLGQYEDHTGYHEMVESEHGEWVRFEDAESELRRWQSLVSAFEALLDRIKEMLP